MLKQDVVIATHVLFEAQIAPPRERFQLADDLWEGKLEKKTAERVLDSCEPPGYWPKKPKRLFSQLYAFVREPAPAEPSGIWDSDLRLQTCIALSRLIQPTSIGFEYAARITYNSDGSVSEIIPGPVKGFGAEAYVANKNGCNWLARNDLNALKEILRHLPLSNFPQRVQRALWYHEYAARSRDVSVRWTLICTALEALVHTDLHGSTKQFTKRVSQLASELGTIQFSEDAAKEAYEFRSRISHGQGSATLDINTQGLYEQMEEVPRETIVRAMRDPDFARIFERDEGIRTQWPLRRVPQASETPASKERGN